MQQLGQYVVSLTAAAMISGIILSLFREGIIRRILRLVCSVVLTITALSPLTNFIIPEFSVFSEACFPEGEAMAAIGEDIAFDETRRRIQLQFEAYILDKAVALGAMISPVIELDDQNMPIGVSLYGTCSQDARQVLTAAITNDLGIPEVDQKWIGEK